MALFNHKDNSSQQTLIAHASWHLVQLDLCLPLTYPLSLDRCCHGGKCAVVTRGVKNSTVYSY